MPKAWRVRNGKVKKVEVDGCVVCGATVGRFRLTDGKKKCIARCAPSDKLRDGAKSTFPFTTTNLGHGPEPITVNSLHHLRRLEREHGVQSEAYNNNSSNFDRG